MKPPADVQAWHELAVELAALKDREFKARQALVAKYFAADAKGTVNVELGRGYKLKGEFRTNYSVDPELAKAALAKFAKADPAGAELADRVVRWVPELRVGEYKKLPSKLLILLRKAVTLKPGAPSLELVEPKAAAA